MKKVYIVCWGSAIQYTAGEDCLCYSNVHNIYSNIEDAVKGLEECRDECYNEIVNHSFYTEDEVEIAKSTTTVRGSVEE